MSGTLLDCVSGALTALGQLGSGQTASPEDGALGFRQANLILSSASANRLMLYNVSTRQFVMSATTPSYTLGPTGVFVGPRPTFVESAQINVGATNYWSPISVWDKRQWDAIRNKGAIADVPDGVYPDYAFPNVILNFNPAPIATPAFRIGTWEQLTQFATLFDQVGNAFPPEYEEWIEAALAVRLAPFYDQQVTQDVMMRLQKAEAAVMSKNAQGLGGALSAAQKFESPNLGQPLPAAGAAPGGA
jgi:hypothetical protein